MQIKKHAKETDIFGNHLPEPKKDPNNKVF